MSQSAQAVPMHIRDRKFFRVFHALKQRRLALPSPSTPRTARTRRLSPEGWSARDASFVGSLHLLPEYRLQCAQGFALRATVSAPRRTGWH